MTELFANIILFLIVAAIGAVLFVGFGALFLTAYAVVIATFKGLTEKN